jgi:hypothetical protein
MKFKHNRAESIRKVVAAYQEALEVLSKTAPHDAQETSWQ